MMIPRLVIAGTHSGCGKTTVASGIMAALTARGLTVQPFKIGPDFIDPSHHTRICHRPSRNLDPFMMGEDGVKNTFMKACKGADIAIIEGVMGMYDGVDGSDCASTAHVAHLLQAPVVLVVDVKGMSRSVHALIGGFRAFDPALNFAGTIFNKVGSGRQRQMIESSLAADAFGWIPRQDDIALKSRHLGLFMAHEAGTLSDAGAVVEQHCDVGKLLAAARAVPLLHSLNEPRPDNKVVTAVTIGVAMDPAFCFYYKDNLDRLRAHGADLVFFSPLNDYLPPADALYFGGGYPELHLAGLEEAESTKALVPLVDGGLPVYAECGGLMYLSRAIIADRTYRMCNALPAEAEMTGRIQALGYVRGESQGSAAFIPSPLGITGHEFHYSCMTVDHDARYAFRLLRGKGIDQGRDGLWVHQALGSYTHQYFTDQFVKAFVRAAFQYKNR
jgi:cobyrinic acid a,c-diamide synthase